jgi:hypothetical protein
MTTPWIVYDHDEGRYIVEEATGNTIAILSNETKELREAVTAAILAIAPKENANKK